MSSVFQERLRMPAEVASLSNQIIKVNLDFHNSSKHKMSHSIDSNHTLFIVWKIIKFTASLIVLYKCAWAKTMRRSHGNLPWELQDQNKFFEVSQAYSSRWASYQSY